LLDHGGDAFAKALSAVFGPVAAGIANVDHISITDIGGTGRGLNQVGNLVPQIVTDTIMALKAKGVDVEELLKKVGANPAGLMQLLAAAPAAASTAAAPVADAAPAADSAPRA
jgi:hypothetical protein